MRECVDGVCRVCKLADAKIVLTTSWRLLPGKVELFNTLLKNHHDAGPIFDVTADLSNEAESASDGATTLDPAHFVRVHERRGLVYDTAAEALRILGAADSWRRAVARFSLGQPCG